MEFGRYTKKKKDFSDRRIFARLPVNLPFRLFEIGTGKISKTQKSLDISANGIGFISKRRLSPNTDLEIWLDMPERKQPLSIMGKVVWSKNLESTDQGWRTGVNFSTVNLVDLGRIIMKKTT